MNLKLNCSKVTAEFNGDYSAIKSLEVFIEDACKMELLDIVSDRIPLVELLKAYGVSTETAQSIVDDLYND